MSSFCPQCGAPAGPGNRFCTSCGAALEADTPEPSVPRMADAAGAGTRGVPLPRTRAGRLGFIAALVLLVAAVTAVPMTLLSDSAPSEGESQAEAGRAPTEPDPEPSTETLRASIGEPLTLTAGDVSLRVKPEAVLDPAPVGEFDEPESGTRYVGVEVQVTNTGSDPYEEGVSPTLLTDDGQEADDAIVTGGECAGGAQDAIPAGTTRRTCITYAVPQAADAAELQLTLQPSSFGDAGAIGVWSLAGGDATESSSADLTPYETPAYAASLPEGWEIVQDYVPQGGRRHVTKAVSPDGDSSVVIDTTADTSGDPADSAATLEAGARESQGYERRAFRQVMLAGTPGFEWAYEQGGTHKVDVLFFEGEDGFGVLTEGPPARAESLGSIARAVAESVRGS